MPQLVRLHLTSTDLRRHRKVCERTSRPRCGRHKFQECKLRREQDKRGLGQAQFTGDARCSRSPIGARHSA